MTTRRLPVRVGDVLSTCIDIDPVLVGRRPLETALGAPRRDLVPTVPTSMRPVTGCTRRIDLPTFRALLGVPTWYLVTQFLVTGRWYEAGLDLAFQLLGCADRYHPVLGAREEADARMKLYALVLDMLDRLDAWDTYLDVWQHLRQGTAYSLSYRGGAATHPRAQPYVLRRAGATTEVHFLWLTDHRHRLIARKLATHRAGRRVGNLRHHPQSELSDAELRRRLAWVAQLARTVRPSRPAPPPGATPDAPAPATRAEDQVRGALAVTGLTTVHTFLRELLAGAGDRAAAADAITGP
jgi:hypothetical protein